MALATFVVALSIGGTAVALAGAELKGDINRDIECLALNIYFEARSEPDLGKHAVGHVVLNRAKDQRFPSDICEVIRQGDRGKRHRCQFSWWCDGESDIPLNSKAWEKSELIAHYVYWGFSQDPTYGALWYHADYVQPYWRKAFVRGPEIGRHIFYLKGDAETRTASN